MNSPYDLGVKCGHFLSMAAGQADVQENIFLGIQNGLIKEIAPWSENKKSLAKEFIDASHHVVLPGLVNSHTHLAMTLFRGVGDDLPFHKWLFDRILPMEAKLVDPEFVRIGSELAMIESIRFGVTSVSDMYFFAETIADVIDRAGIRGWVSQTFASAPLPEDAVVGRDKSMLFEKLFERYKDHPRVQATLGPHAPYTCDDDLLKEVARLSQKHSAGIQIHLCETKREVEDSFRLHGKSPVQRLHDLGVLTERTLCAHCVHLSDDDIQLMLKAGASVAHNPDSNLKLSSGIAPITKYRQAGIPVALGTDGSASNNDLSIFGAMDLGTKLQKLASGDNTAMVAADALRCATFDGARALGWQNKLGSLEVGKEADLIAVDLRHPHLQPVHDVRSHLVYSTQGLEVDTVICRGRVLMKNKEFLTLDQDKVFAEARQVGLKIRAAETILEKS